PARSNEAPSRNLYGINRIAPIGRGLHFALAVDGTRHQHRLPFAIGIPDRAELLPAPAAWRLEFRSAPATPTVHRYFDHHYTAVCPRPTPNFNVAWPNVRLRRRADNYRLRRNLPHRPRTGPVGIVVEKRREGPIRTSIREMQPRQPFHAIGAVKSWYQQTQRKAVLGIQWLAIDLVGEKDAAAVQTIERTILQIWARTDAVVFSVIEPV